MRAIFIGRDGSMRLKHGAEYEIEIIPYRAGFAVTIPSRCWACPYDTFNGILKNWYLIQEKMLKNRYPIQADECENG